MMEEEEIKQEKPCQTYDGGKRRDLACGHVRSIVALVITPRIVEMGMME